VVLAPVCAACRHQLDEPSRSVVCASCWNAVRALTPPFCDVCGDPLATWRTSEGRMRCARCPQHRSRITIARAIGEYDGALRDIIHVLKYRQRQSVAVELGALMRSNGRAVLSGADAVVPVPLHWRRQWRRGFNQAEALASNLDKPVRNILRRNRHTPSQTDLPADERHRNVRNAFSLRRRADVTGLCVVIVDDVSTTGATLDACARVLLRAGAREVRALTAARVASRLRA
jgi:ComF family protein